MKSNELYFTLTLTENEHYIVNDMIETFCKNSGLELKYYRKFKIGHIPGEREIKVTGNNSDLIKFAKFCISEYLIGKDGNFPNYWRENPAAKEICDSCNKKKKIVFYGELKKVDGKYTCEQLCRSCWKK